MPRKHKQLEGMVSAAGLVVLVAGLLSGCEARRRPEPQTRPAKTQRDENYIAALSAVDDFCNAWKQRDEAAGRALLSRPMLLKYPDRQLRDAIVGMSNPQHAAFEIADGKKLSSGRYQFKVRLFFQYTGLHADRIESPLERIVVARDDKGVWRVDDFPIPQVRKSVR